MLTKMRIRGFTLLELMVVVAIIAVLFSIAMPRYQIYSLRANRTDAFAIMNEVLQAQERFAADTGSYTVDLTELGYLANQPSADGNYVLAASACGAGIVACVLLTASAQNSQKDDKNGEVDGEITINSRGTKTGW